MEMNRETELVLILKQRFGIPEEKCVITRARRIFAEAPYDRFMEIMECAQKELGFDYLCTITGLDSGENLEFIYHLADRNGILLNLKLFAPKSDPKIPTVTGLFNGAIFYERELADMLGTIVEGMPAGRRYPLPEEWPADEFPLRKDWIMQNPVEPIDIEGGE
jgi:membrane-bound hydrogenase subunit beta